MLCRFLAQLVLTTFATGSDVSVVIQNEIQFIFLEYLTGVCGLINLLYVPGHIVLAELKVMFNFLYLFVTLP